VTVSVDAGGFSSTTLTNEAGVFSVPCVPTLAGGLCLSGYRTGGGQTSYFIVGGITPVPGGVTATGTHTLIVNDSAFVLIPGGAFQMGDSFRELQLEGRPVHQVNVSAFFLQARETTKAEWDTVRTWALANGYTFENLGLGKGTDHPVHSVSWYDVVKWCNARSQKEGLVPCYYTNVARTTVYKTGRVDVTNDQVLWTANGYRLPTEAEWEKAARGGLDGKRFPWGDTITHSLANYNSLRGFVYDVSPTRWYHPKYATGGFPTTSPVGSFAANGYGLHDMTGNVFEWCWDRYGDAYYRSSPETDPRGPSTGSIRVHRGGSWVDAAIYGRVAHRDWDFPYNSPSWQGFRPARGR
jgi:formylglycine-generating enzyme required for sulfatase activity